MRLSLIPRSMWNMSSVFDEDDDNNWLSSFSATTGTSVSEDDKHVFVTAALPGLEEKDIDITFDKGMLWIKGEKEETEEDKKKKFYRRSESSFSYRIAVPGEIDSTSEPEATFKNSVMTVRFAKSPAAQPKKITVKSGK